MKLQTYREPAVWREGAPLAPADVVEKEEAHRRGLLHLSVHLLLVDDEGRIHARRRSDDDLRYAGRWTSTLGTHVAAGETYEATLRALVPADVALARVGEFRVKDEHENEVCGLFVTRAAAMQSALTPQHRALAPAELEHLVAENATTPHLAAAWRRYREA